MHKILKVTGQSGECLPGKTTLTGNRLPSRTRAPRLFFALIVLLSAPLTHAVDLSPAEAKKVGHKIWQNECNGTVSGLTSWNTGENFASLGIGHFIWYPAGVAGPFEESFPKLVTFLQSRKVSLPDFLARNPAQPCPWKTRAEFIGEKESPQMKSLRAFLAATIDLQAEFLIQRLENALPKMMAAADSGRRDQVRRHFEQLSRSGSGCYALIDYVNFKGEGTKDTERYQGQGWGLLQVLEGMNDGSSTPAEFARSAKAVLTRRVKNSPSDRNEARWLPGWLNRINTYVNG